MLFFHRFKIRVYSYTYRHLRCFHFNLSFFSKNQLGYTDIRKVKSDYNPKQGKKQKGTEKDSLRHLSHGKIFFIHVHESIIFHIEQFPHDRNRSRS
jgi:hypothetical protein